MLSLQVGIPSLGRCTSSFKSGKIYRILSISLSLSLSGLRSSCNFPQLCIVRSAHPWVDLFRFACSDRNHPLGSCHRAASRADAAEPHFSSSFSLPLLSRRLPALPIDHIAGVPLEEFLLDSEVKVLEEMKDGASASSLAITEKRPAQQKPGGGCIGVFFQLFNWKKKLFSKKLLPPGDTLAHVSISSASGNKKICLTLAHLFSCLLVVIFRFVTGHAVSGAAKRVSKKIAGREEKMQKASMAKLLLVPLLHFNEISVSIYFCVRIML